MDRHSISLGFLPKLRSPTTTYTSLESPVPNSQSSSRRLRRRCASKTAVVSMLSFYTIAIFISGIHVVFYFLLDSKAVEETLSQSTQTFISNMLAIAFELSCLSCISIAYSQRVWRLFRRSPMKASTINRLYTLPRNLSNLLHCKIFQKAPVEAVIGLVCVLLPIAATFPPSALNLAPGQFPQPPARVANVSAFQMLDYESRSLENVSNNGLFVLDLDLYYMYPKPDVFRIAQQTLMDRDALPWSNQCLESNSPYQSPNCTYELSLRGTTINCVELQANETNLLSNPDDKPYLIYEANEPIPGEDIFHIGWYPSMEFRRSNLSDVIKSNRPKFLNCSTSFADYSVNVTFDNSKRILQHIDLKPGKPLLHGYQLSFYEHFYSNSSDTPLRDLESEYEFAQGSAIRDAILSALSGDMNIGAGIFWSDNGTLILQSRFANVTFVGNDTLVEFNITSEGLAELFRDVTLSLVSLAHVRWKTDKPLVIEMPYVNKYTFNEKLNIFVPYGLGLVLTGVIALLGLFAMNENGGAAHDDFLDTVCATRASKILDYTAKRGWSFHRDDENRFSEELKELTLVIGEIQQEQEQQYDERRDSQDCDRRSTVLTGFGTLEEVRNLNRRTQ